jgi:hypothetical protein
MSCVNVHTFIKNKKNYNVNTLQDNNQSNLKRQKKKKKSTSHFLQHDNRVR